MPSWQAAALALTGEKLAYGTFELSAPGMVNRVELAAMMSETLGRNIEAGEPSFDEWARMANIPDGPLREGLHTCTRTTTCMASPVATLSCCGRFSAASPARYNSIFVSLPTDSFTAF